MATQTAKGRRADPVIQFSIFTPNRLGRLHDLIRFLGARGVHVLALMVLDTTHSAIIRVVVDDPDSAREMLQREGFPFTESKLVAVEVSTSELNRLMSALLEAELNISGNKITVFKGYADATAWGQGTYTPGAPSGKFPIKFAFLIAPATKDSVAPQAAMFGREYLGR